MGKSIRQIWLDSVRGFFIILMAIDHASYFIINKHQAEFWGISPEHYTSITWFLSRFVTHFCAPGFFFIMGISMVLFANARMNKGWSKIRIIKHFTFRGCLLVVLQMLLENPAWMIGGKDAVSLISIPGGTGEVWFHFGVLYSLGISMILCSLLLYIQPRTILIISICSMIMPIFVIPRLNIDTLYSPIFRLLVIPGQTNLLQVFYPVFPWVGIAGAGWVFGKILITDKEHADKLFLWAGILFIILFFCLRFTGLGNFHNQIPFSFISFFNLTKYPPSPLFILLTLGVDFILLFYFSKNRIGEGFLGSILNTFGRSALFFYIAHLYCYAIMGLFFPGKMSIAILYSGWLAGLVILFPLCNWYGKFKNKSQPDSIIRLF